MDEKVKYWVDLAEYDLITAQAMLDTQRFLYVGFMCHQIIEKLLKGYFVKKNNETPPFSHNLRYLAEASNILNEFDNKRLMFIISLQPLNIEARYPSYKEELLKNLTNEYCESLIENTKEFFEWIKKML
jgi:HEPN domain-containing protein